ncbi:unnamed protein product [Mycena citricolor]|uniref:BRO domain-containing protein 1 n=1 Tax=Mycena citricolor TaxID=2018698 RepID=A0AAD2HHJ4_9AGAR|nr:unnamed protein product [Mycena citricolor]CAK5274217.1 unnamed protein product [Mycena citricolor]
MSQTPMISIPRKTTEEVDWTTPIRNLIAQSYGENPDSYAAECASLQRCRQDAVRGAGSDLTAKDLLYKYFGQLELLELRFSEIRVSFPWHDAFTLKLTTQTSIAYEKASILFQIASTHSSIAISQNRSSPEGLKRAFYYFRTCAGMLTYITENFLHAPSKDLSKEVVKFLVSLIIAQATEVFWEKCVEEKKGSGLISKIASQAANMYNVLCEEVKEFSGQNILDRNWVTLIQIKSKYMTSEAQYHRSLADTDAGLYGDALARLTLAETHAKEAYRLCSSFNPIPASSTTPNSSTFPSDAGSSMLALAKAHLAVVSDRRATAYRENDLIYNAVVPSLDSLPSIETKAMMTIATPIPIQEVYGNPDVQKTIGQDFFSRLVPLSVHESASVYSEEKAKLVRAETERCETANVEARSFVDGLGVVTGLERFRAMLRESGSGGPPAEISRWATDLASLEARESVPSLFAQLEKLKQALQHELDPAGGISLELDSESRECEMMRVRFEHRWTQAPSAGLTKSLRQDLKAHLAAMDEAAKSDAQVQAIWQAIQSDIALLVSGRFEAVFAEPLTEQMSLLDLGEEADRQERQDKDKLASLIQDAEEHLSTLKKIERERTEVLKDLKDKIQADDVSHLLLLNRRNTGVEPSLFAAELEKFRPYQQRLAATIHHQDAMLQELDRSWRLLNDSILTTGPFRKWENRERRKTELLQRFGSAKDRYNEVRDGLGKGLQFYSELTELTAKLRRNVKAFVSGRNEERQQLVSQLAPKQSSYVSWQSPPPPPPLLPTTYVPPPLPPPPASTFYSSLPPPPPPHDPYANIATLSNTNEKYNTPLPPPAPPSQPGYSQYHRY